MTNQTEQTQTEQENVAVNETEQATVNGDNQDSVAEQVEQNEAQDPTIALNARLQELETYIAEADKREQDIVLRARAEVENIRRRSEQDVEKAHKFALEKFSKELLNVVDNLERALQTLASADDSVKGLAEGVELTHKGLVSTLTNFGVEAVGAVGDAFDPELHQAISMQAAEGIETNHISAVLQKGYTLHGRVIRPAMVMVAS